MKLIKNYFYNVCYQMLVLILPLITAPYISRTLGPKGVGQYSFTYSIITWFTLITSIGIAYYGDRQVAYVRDNKYQLSKTFYELQIIKITMTVISMVIFIAFINIYHRYTFLLCLQAINILASTIDISWLYMGLENFKVTVIRNTLVKITSVILIFIFIHSSSDTWLYVLILAMSTFLGNLTLWPELRKILVFINFRDLRPYSHLHEALILFLPSVATKIYLNLNKTMLGVIAGSTAAGFYQNSDNLIQIIISIVTATGTVILPHAANEYAKGNNNAIKNMLYTSFDFVSFLAFPMAFGAASISLKLSIFFYGNKFAPVGPVMMIESIVIVMVAWSNAIGIQYLLPMKRTKDYTRSLVVSAIFSMIISIPLIYFWGLHGAIITTVLSEGIVTLYQLVVVHNEINLKRLFKDVPKFLLSSSIMFMVVFFLNKHWQFNLFSMIGEVGIGIMIYIIMIIILRPTILKKTTIFLNLNKKH